MSALIVSSGDSYIDNFRETISPRSRRKLITCPNGCNLQSVTHEYKVDWKFFICHCSSCSIRWHICLNCPHQKRHFLCPSALKRHQKNCFTWTLRIRHRASSQIDSSIISCNNFLKFRHFGSNENRDYY